MGTDANAHSGVLVHSNNVIEMLTAAMSNVDIPAVVTELLSAPGCREELKELQVFLQVADPDDEDEKEIICAGTADELLEKATSPLALKHWLETLCKSMVGGDTGKYSECWVVNDDLLEHVFRQIAKACSVELPGFSLEAFGNARLSGLWNIEYGELYFNFEVEECFERILTPAGQALQRRLKESLGVSEWVTISY